MHERTDIVKSRLIRILLSAVIAASTAVYAGGIGAAPASASCSAIYFWAYTNGNYGGDTLGACNSVSNFGAISTGPFPWQTFDNAISSLRFGGRSVSFYDNANYSNFLHTYANGSNVGYVGDALNDRFDSAWVN
jgi:Peptidase inhibitor family I36